MHRLEVDNRQNCPFEGTYPKGQAVLTNKDVLKVYILYSLATNMYI